MKYEELEKLRSKEVAVKTIEKTLQPLDYKEIVGCNEASLVSDVLEGYSKALRLVNFAPDDYLKRAGYFDQAMAIKNILESKKAAFEASPEYAAYSLDMIEAIKRTKLPKELSLKIGKIDYTIEKSGFWNQFSYHLMPHQIDEFYGHKIQISLERTPENIHKAYDILLPILTKHPVQVFKIAHLEQLQAGCGQNPDGKECIILVPEIDKDPMPWLKMLQAIEDAFVENGVSAGSRPMGDALLNGSRGYMYIRGKVNILGEYTSPILLQRAGFTREEAARVTDEHLKFWGKLQLNPGGVKESKHVIANENIRSVSNVDVTQAVDVEAVNAINAAYRAQLKMAQLFVDLDTKTLKDQPITDKTARQMVSGLFHHDRHERRSSVPPTLIAPLLEPLLEKSASLVAMIHQGLFAATGNKCEIASIVPVIYHEVCIPVIKYAIEHNQTDEWMKRRLKKPSPYDQELVRLIVKASLRDKAVEQIHHDTPQYVLGMSDVAVEGLVSAALKVLEEEVALKLKRSQEEPDSALTHASKERKVSTALPSLKS